MNRLHMHQKVTLMVNRYEIFADDGAGEPGALVAFVEQKRMAFKEQVTIYTDSSKAVVLAGFKARKVIDLASGYDVLDGNGQPIGFFRKDFGKSLINSTWHLDQPGAATATGRERSQGVAIFRRIWNFIPFIENFPFPMRYHFDFARGGQPVFNVDKKTWLRDHYLLEIKDPYIDRRVVIAQAVAVDALQSR
ncbi:hypothetical protein [Umezawaea sp. Da 62-37]|uniref:hypothetical protein n=1 Tax=Umezawaea sp. Da 62-37 TaxID=3075927 RepID=UPI0028F6EA0E|nr:hypothetical protein [Umezawaea sp. Da 62-37]WNV83740.1 hypothetical protein RM788_37015 [Umezawaea sp. Da 62-37]